MTAPLSLSRQAVNLPIRQGFRRSGWSFARQITRARSLPVTAGSSYRIKRLHLPRLRHPSAQTALKCPLDLIPAEPALKRSGSQSDRSVLLIEHSSGDQLPDPEALGV